MRRLAQQALILAAALAAWLPAWADPHPPAPVEAAAVLRSGEHPHFSRLVFDLPPGARPELTALPGGLRVRLRGAALSAPSGVPHALTSLAVSGDAAVLSWPPGSTMRSLHLPGRLVIDVLPRSASAAADPELPAHGRPAHTGRMQEPAPVAFSLPPALQEPPARVPAPSQLAPAPAKPGVPVPAPAAAPPAPPSPPVTAAAPAAAVGAAPLPGAVAAAAASGPTPAAAGPLAIAAVASADDAPAALLPFAPGTGAAAFRRGAWGVAVFDEARPVDLAPLRGRPGFGGAEIRLLPDATVLRVPLAADQSLTLARDPQGWSVRVQTGDPAMLAVRPQPDSGALDLPLAQPGRIVAMPDADSGGLLLVGTQAGDAAAAAGMPPLPQGVAVARHAPAFDLLATWRGVVVDPAQDSLTLAAAPAGFVLRSETAGPPLALDAFSAAAALAADAGRFSRRFDLPNEGLAALARRLQAATALAASRPPQDRGAGRLAVAQAMLALGMGPEAGALVRLATTDDPRLLRDPQARALAGAAALLAGRDSEAGALDDPGLTAPGQPGADETMLWRGLLSARRAAGAPDPAAAQTIAARLPLLLSYPESLRARLLPAALRCMIRSGEAAAARLAVDARPGDASLDYERALLDAEEGQAPDALARLDRLARSPDRDIAARAAVRAVELRLDTHALTPLQAADALDALTDAWRGDRRELAVRLREASLRLDSGQLRRGLAMLRETADPVLAEGWPDRLPGLHAGLAAAFAQAVRSGAAQRMSPLDFVAMVQENADLMPAGEAGQKLAGQVADRLAALGLPDQAAAALSRLMEQSPPGVPRAALGARLAALQVDQQDPAGALRTLSASAQDGLPAGLTETRTLLFARATALRGDLPAAAGALAALGTAQADALRASLFEAAAQWPDATAALQLVADRTLPAAGPLTEAQAPLLLRLASAAARAGDAAALAAERARYLQRLPPGRSADLLRVLTEPPVHSVADLPRAGTEMALARTALR